MLLLLTGPFVFLAIPLHTRYLIRIALIAVVSLRAIQQRAFFLSPALDLYIISAVILIVVVFGVVITFTERDAPIPISPRWARESGGRSRRVSTVGYGDTFPVTDTGRVIATGLMFFGVAVFSILTATLANSFAAGPRKKKQSTNLSRCMNDSIGSSKINRCVRRARRTRAPQPTFPPDTSTRDWHGAGARPGVGIA